MGKMRGKIALLLAAALVVTGIQVPVYGAPDENVTVTEVAEEAVVETAEVIEETTEDVTEDTPVGADSTIYVRSAEELVSALNGENLPTNEKVRIQLESNCELTKEVLSGKNLTIKDGADITLDLNHQTVALSENAATYKIEVPKATSFSVIGDDEYSCMEIGIINSGTLNLIEGGIECYYGDALVNDTGAVANLENIYIYSFQSHVSDAVVVRNAGRMTIGKGSDIEAYGASCVAMENTGEMLINSAYVYACVDTPSACGIKNIGANANLSIRGFLNNGNSMSSGYGIFNDAGTVTLGSYAADAIDTAYIKAGKRAVLTVNGGTVIGYEGMDVRGGVATTPFAGDETYTGTTDGVFKMLGGEIDKVIYSEQSLPILIGRVVGNTTVVNAQALELMVSADEIERDPLKYFYLNEKDGTPISGAYTVDGETKVAYAIVKGEVYQPESLNIVYITSETELRNAVVSGGNIELGENIALTEELVFTKDATIFLNNKKLTQASANATITVKEGVTASIVGSYSNADDIGFTQMKSDASVITNYGDLTLQNVSVEASNNEDATVSGAKAIMNHGSMQIEDNLYKKITIGVKDGIAIDNAGTLNVTGNSSPRMLIAGSAEKDGMTALRNSGTCTLRGRIEIDGVSGVSANDATAIDNSGTCTITSSSVSVYGYTGKNSANRCVAVQNTGSFVMQSGTVRGGNAGRGGEDNYTIVYTEDHYPVLMGGEVYGTAESSASNPVYGSAVAKKESNGTYSRGYFRIANSKELVLVDGQNATLIHNGVPDVATASNAKTTYLLLQTGDVVRDIETAFSFDGYISSSQGEYTTEITSSDPETASVSTNGTNWTLRANKAGYTILKAKRSLNGSCTVEDYLRIEVTDDKATLTAEDYEGSLLENQVVVNAYTNDEYAYEVPFEIHLSTSEMATGAEYSDFGGAQSDSFTIDEIIIDDKEFNQYFELEGFFADVDTKLNSFEFTNIESSNGASTKLLEDEVKSVTDVEVKAKIYNKASQKDMLITLGSIDISVQAGKPVVKATGGYTLNSAYNSSAKYAYEIGGNWETMTAPNYKDTLDIRSRVTAAVNGETISIRDANIKVKALSDGLGAVNGNMKYITAIAKKGKETVTTEVTLGRYVGTYQVNLPVTITNKYPKVALNQKTVTVSQKSSAETDIPLRLCAKDAESVGMVDSVEIVTAKGKTSNYTVGKTAFAKAYLDSTLKGYESNTFYLQPKSILNKAETVTLKVTYKNTNAKAGKAYSTIVKVKVKPVSKFTVKQHEKASLCTNSGNEVRVLIKTAPENFEGAKLVVTKLNGQAEIPEEVDTESLGSAASAYGSGVYKVYAFAKENTKARGKKLEFGIAWVDENGQMLTGTKVTKMTVSLFEDTSKLETTEATITVQPEKIYKKVVLYDEYYLDEKKSVRNQFTTSLKITGKGEWDMTDYEDTMFHISSSGKKIVLEANENIIGGTEYEIPLTFTNRNTQETKIVNLTVKVADVKKVTAKFDTDTVTLYKAAPYTMQWLATGVGFPFVTAPIAGAGLTEIKKVEIADASSPFEIYEYNYYTAEAAKIDVYQQYGITFKDKKYPTKATAKALKSVTVKITYGNGIDDNYKTAFVKLKVNIK